MKKKLVVLLLTVAMAATVFSGCGKNDATGGAASAATETSADQETATSAEISTEDLLAATDYDVTELVKLNDYKNMTVELSSSYEVTEEDIKSYAESLVANYPLYTESDKKTVEDGDIANIDYVGKMDGEAFDGGTDSGYNLTIGSGTFIPGFEDQLIGVNVGDTVDLNVTFPEDYSSTDLAGKDAVFTVTVNAIMNKETMTYENLTDEYIESNFGGYGVTTVEDFLSEVESGVASNNATNKSSEMQGLVLDKLVAECEVNLPEGMAEERYQDYKARVEAAAEEAGVDFGTYLQNYMGYTEETFEADMPAYIEDSLKQEMILEAIVAAEGLTISQSDFDSFVSSYVEYYGYESNEAFLEAYGGEAYVKLSYAENVILSDLISNTNTTVAE